MPYFRFEEAELFYTDEGAGSPLVLVHGWTCDSHDWSWQIQAFSESHRVVALDLRGHGYSSSPKSGYNPRVFADDVAALITHLELGPVILIGHSLGGAVAAVLAVERPELVRAVVEVDPAYGLTGELERSIKASLPVLRGLDVLTKAAAMIDRLRGPETSTYLRVWRRRRVLGMRPLVVTMSHEAIWEGEHAFGFRPATDQYLAARTCPVLCVTADMSRGSWECETFQDAISRLVPMEGFGHWPHQEHHDQFNSLVLEWIGSLPK